MKYLLIFTIFTLAISSKVCACDGEGSYPAVYYYNYDCGSMYRSQKQQQKYAPAPTPTPAPTPRPESVVPEAIEAIPLESSIRKFKTKANPSLVVELPSHVQIQSVEHIQISHSGNIVKVPVVNGYLPYIDGNVCRYTHGFVLNNYQKLELVEKGYLVYTTNRPTQPSVKIASK